MISIVILAYNSAASIKRTLASIEGLSDDIHVVDSFSTDDTVAICKAAGCHVVQRAFANYSDQRNWAIDNLPLRHGWQLHVDADEEFEPALRHEIAALDLRASPVDGYIICRKLVFMGRVIRFSSIAKTWHMRLFRTGHGRCESRLYDQHFVCTGTTATLRGFMLDHQEATLSEWTARHNRWSDLEVMELLRAEPPSAGIKARLTGNPIERRRYQKQVYYRLPLLVRPFIYFLKRYVLQLGFLDGRTGLIFHLLQAFWFRFLVDAKLFEAQRNAMLDACETAEADHAR